MKIIEEIKKLIQQNELAAAKQKLNEFVSIYGVNSEVNFLLGTIFYKENDIFKAATHFTKVLKESSENVENIKLLADCLHKLNMSEPLKLLKENFGSLFREEKSGVNEEYDEDSLRILFLQYSPCIRNFKYAQALKKRGHRITLVYLDKKLSERYKGLSDDVYYESIKINNFRELWDLAQNYDLLHSHNEPDKYTVAALGAGIPVIHDTHDLVSLRDRNNQEHLFFEGIANRAVSGNIYTTPYQRQKAERLYGPSAKSLIFYNYASEDHLPKKLLPKLSSSDGKIHFVYEGGIDRNGYHRDFGDQFIELAKRGIYVHIYPDLFRSEVEEYFKPFRNILYNRPVSPEILLTEMSQFDFGIIPWNLEKGDVEFLGSTIANKLFEYMAAGLPVATSEIISYIDFFNENPVGITYKNIDDLVARIPVLEEIRNTTDFSKQIFTYESQIERLEKFYKNIIESSKKQNWGGKIPRDENADVNDSMQRLLKWINHNGWSGYDPYDIYEYISHRERIGGIDETTKRLLLVKEKEDGLSLRKELGITPRINAKAMGLLLASYSILFQVFDKREYLAEAEKIESWLSANKSKGYKNSCWGYPFDWQSKIFIPKDTPSAVVSVTVGNGYWELYCSTKNSKFLKECESIAEFIVSELNIDKVDESSWCISYTPLDNFHVHNANLMAAEYIAKIGCEIENENYQKIARKLLNYTLSEQNNDGSIYYWGRIQKQYGQYVDHYHSGFEIRSLYALAKMFNDITVEQAFERYYDFYLKNFFDKSKVLHTPNSHSLYNIHSCAEAIIVNCLVGEDKHNIDLESIIEWVIKSFQNENGSFGYLIDNGKYISTPFLRWAQAWMLRAFAEYFRSKKRAEWGYFAFGKTGKKAAASPNDKLKDGLLEERLLLKEYLNIGNVIPDEMKKQIEHVTGQMNSVDSLIKNPSAWREKVYSIYDNEEQFDFENLTIKSYKCYQISMPDQKGLQYGTKEWSENLFENAISDPWGQDWRASQLVRYQKAMDMLKTNIGKTEIQNVLDIGCALGDFTIKLFNYFEKSCVTGVDISVSGIRKCRERFKFMNFEVASLPLLQISNVGKYQLISAMEVICYVPQEHLNTALNRLYELVEDKGYLLISVYMNKPPFYNVANFEEFISQKFEIIDTEKRYHNLYYEYDIPIRDVMEKVNNLNNAMELQAKAVVEQYIQSGFNLLRNYSFLHQLNELGERKYPDKALSHEIILARKK